MLASKHHSYKRMHQITVHKLPQLSTVLGRELSRFIAAKPSWVQLGELPSANVDFIRKIGSELFSHFTKSPLLQIQVLSSLNPECSARDINVVAAFLKAKGTRKQDASIIFEEYFPGYQADIVVYQAMGFEFMLVIDEFGKYIYAYEPLTLISGAKLLESIDG